MKNHDFTSHAFNWTDLKNPDPSHYITTQTLVGLDMDSQSLYIIATSARNQSPAQHSPVFKLVEEKNGRNKCLIRPLLLLHAIKPIPAVGFLLMQTFPLVQIIAVIIFKLNEN